MMNRIYVATVLILLSYPAAAEQFAIQGLGATTCVNFVDMYRLDHTASMDLYHSWAQGFMSATNLEALHEKHPFRDLSSLPIKEQEDFLRKYCDAHPLADIMSAVSELYKQFPLVSEKVK